MSIYKLLLTLLLSSSLLVTGCSIKDDSSNEQKVTNQKPITTVAKTKTQRFVNQCTKCILGDLSELEDIIATYKSSFTPKTSYPKGAFLYQKITPTLAFERCAQKAMLLGDNRAYKEMFVRQGKIARSARYFYATNKPAQGAFWLQRLINIKGEVDAYEIAGRIFIQDLRTISIGSRLLEQSARMGNRNARQMLLALMQPGSVYYQQITKNTFTEDEADQSNEAMDKFDAQLDDLPKKMKKEKLLSKSELLAAHDDDDENKVPAFFSLEPPADNQESSSNGSIAVFSSQNEVATPKARVLPEPTSLRLGYYDAALAADNQETTPAIKAPEEIAQALESSDSELDVPLEAYPSATEVKKTQERRALIQQRTEQIDKQRQELEQKVNQALQATQKR